VDVLTMSADSVYVHKVWNENELSEMVGEDIPFPMLSDQTGTVGTAYGVYIEEIGINLRGTFLIDPDGVIQAMEVLAPEVGRNVNELIRQVKAFQHVRETKGTEATPSGWQPGKATLKPGPELVGNVWKEWKPSDVY
jgi:alkyl hydroperoxide reductase subunit AhpC